MLERNIIGKRIKQIRQDKRITQDQLAARLNIQGIEIDQTMISKIEEQVRGIPDYEIKAHIDPIFNIFPHSKVAIITRIIY